jgi:hypothetical protein
MVSPLIESNLPFLRNIHSFAKCPKKIEKIIKNATDGELLCLVEISLNILKGRLPLGDGRRARKLKNQVNTIRRISRTRTAKSARRLLLPEQKGKGLPAIAGILASVLIPMIAEKIQQYK